MLINAYPPNVVQLLLEKLDLSADVSLYAVLDHSFDPQLIQKLKNQITWVSLYQDQGNPEHEICPLLCLIDTDTPTALHSQLALLLQASEGWPMLSFWLSNWDRESLFAHFDHYFDVTILPEKLSYVLRYADTRVLPNLLAQLNAEQRAHFMLPFEQLIYFNRAAEPIALRPAAVPIEARQKLSLDETQFTALLDAAQPDQIIHQLAQLNTPELQAMQAAQLHQQIASLCQTAQQNGLNDDAKIKTFCLERILDAAEK